jgi:hypothetical protein
LQRVPLCILSHAQGGPYCDGQGRWNYKSYEHQPCPLGLDPKTARVCSCKKRETVYQSDKIRSTKLTNVQVLTCTFPETFTGDTIEHPAAFANYLRRKRASA